MKRLKLAVIALFALVTVSNVNAQDENNPWVVGFGINNVDYYGNSNFVNQVKDLLGNRDWNVIPAISRISAEKYLDNGFTLQVAGSLNKIKTVATVDDSDFIYYGIDAIVKYDLNNLFGDTSWFDPYVYLGGGYTSADSKGEGMLNVGVGFNTWVSDNFGINFQTGTKKGFSGNVGTHYQTTAGLVFKFGGKDTDGDGVYDKDDACPEVAGLKAFNGCPDADGDGVKDADDACPNVAGLASLNGCPDADGDGVADKNDMCPNSKGTKANKGCPDTDGDGVVDKNDGCPQVAGPTENKGCPWPDTDKDGVLDKDDNCINEAGPASNNGCPEISKAEIAQLEELFKTVYFDSGKNTFKEETISKLDEAASIMQKFTTAKFNISGHTDSTGSKKRNLELSESRANAVKDYLVSKGDSSSNLTAKGFGEDMPIASNNTRSGRSKNRRVEVKLID